MKRASLGARLRYAFDNTMSKGTGTIIGWLAIISALIILIVASVVWLAGFTPETKGFTDVVWMGLMRTLDSGTMGGDEGSWGFLFSMLAVTLVGIFIISTLIGVLTEGIRYKLMELRKGRSKVIEEGHSVILGWSPQVFTIIAELVKANENQRRRSCIVILADKDKVDMEDEIHSRVGPMRRTSLVCRRGDPMDRTDVELVSLDTAKSILILSHEVDDPDTNVIKTILAVTNNPNRDKPYHIVAEIRDRRNIEVAEMVGKDEVEIVSVSDAVARIMAQTCRLSGLSIVYTELFEFTGCEIYFHEPEPEVIGKIFRETLALYEKSTVIGIFPQAKKPQLNPKMDTVITEGSKLIVIANDDDTTKLSGKTDLGINLEAIVTPGPKPPGSERILILGWNRRAPLIILELEKYMGPGSHVQVVADSPEVETKLASDILPTPKNLTITFREGHTTSRSLLDSLDIPSYQHVILLCCTDTMGSQHADAHTLITLLHLRDIADKSEKKFNIVSEMMDVRNSNLAEAARADDFIVSDRIVSLLMAQISENKHLNAVFADLFAAEGSEIYVKPAANYIKLSVELNFYTVLEAARKRGEIAIGYKLARYSTDETKHFGVTMNPNKSEVVSYAEQDKIVLIAED